jgi:hypothetical protein
VRDMPISSLRRKRLRLLPPHEPGRWFLTAREDMWLFVANVAALVGLVILGPVVYAIVAPVWVFALYRSVRRGYAPRRAGLIGFVSQGARVSDDERARKIAVRRAELRGWEPGLRWLREVDARATRPSRRVDAT